MYGFPSSVSPEERRNEANIIILNLLQKDKEDLEEVSMELELADEDELVP